MGIPIGTTLTNILLAIRTQLITVFDPSACSLALEPDKDDNEQADVTVLITPGVQRFDQSYIVGAGNVQTFCRGEVIITIKARVQQDPAWRADQLLTDPVVGVLAQADAVTNLLEMLVLHDANGNQIQSEPCRQLSQDRPVMSDGVDGLAKVTQVWSVNWTRAF